MNTNESTTVEGKILILENMIKSLSSTVDELKSELKEKDKLINALKIDNQSMLRCNKQIQPGIGTKVAYDKHGLVTASQQLTEDDIPILSIDKISGLRQLLEEKTTLNEVKRVVGTSGNTSTVIPYGTARASGSGIKVAWNSNGQIISSSGLIPSDIPNIPISNVTGLEERLSLLESYDTDNEDIIEEEVVTPGSYTKVDVDNNGKVVNGTSLTEDDLPYSLKRRLNTIESAIPSLASRKSVDALTESNNNKVDSLDKPVSSGTYTKLTVNQDGLVTGGAQLTKDDLPTFGIHDIDKLESTLRGKVDINQFTPLSDTISSLVHTMENVGEVVGMKNELQRKADDTDLKDLSNTVKRMSSILDNLLDKNVDEDLYLIDINSIKASISTIEGRLYTIESSILPDGLQ